MLRRCESCAGDVNEELLLALKSWRLEMAREQKMPPYIIFSDNTLVAIAEMLPEDETALIAIPGIGARKLEQYGPDVLELVKQFR
jgi:DNA helicase-2/ATP-dependent DNA helicase PcrA